jgi:hypothetical protein
MNVAPALACPRCRGVLGVPDPAHDLGLDEQICAGCGGCLLPRAGAASLWRTMGIGADVVQQLALDPALRPRREAAGPLACPCDGQALAPVTLKGVVVDLCLGCQALWLDGGELARMSGGRAAQLPSPSFPPSPSLPPPPSSTSLSPLLPSTPLVSIPRAVAPALQGPTEPPALELAWQPGPRRASRDLEEVFEMLWDCSSCGSKGLLGRSHRHCPNCGAPQDPAERYFPPAGQDIRAAAYRYEGADRICGACTTPNGGLAKCCKNCGAPLDGSARVTVERHDKATRSPAPRTRAATPAGRAAWVRARWRLLIGAAVVLGIVVAVLWTKDVEVVVAGHAWQRTIGIETLAPRRDSAWCDAMPFDAYNVSRSREVRSHRQIPDGETCTTERKSRGDGSYTNERSCRPKYRSEPVYDDRCRYTVDRWGEDRAVTASGDSLAAPPRWPDLPPLRTGTSLGSEREGQHRQRYTVHLRGPSDTYACDYDEARWRLYAVGAKLPLKVRVVGGSAVCGSLGKR